MIDSFKFGQFENNSTRDEREQVMEEGMLETSMPQPNSN